MYVYTYISVTWKNSQINYTLTILVNSHTKKIFKLPFAIKGRHFTLFLTHVGTEEFDYMYQEIKWKIWMTYQRD